MVTKDILLRDVGSINYKRCSYTFSKSINQDVIKKSFSVCLSFSYTTKSMLGTSYISCSVLACSMVDRQLQGLNQIYLILELVLVFLKRLSILDFLKVQLILILFLLVFLNTGYQNKNIFEEA